MLNKYRKFLNSNSISRFGDIPLKLNGSYRFEKVNDDMIFFKISINLGYNLIKEEVYATNERVKEKLQNFIDKYFTNIEKYELDDLYDIAEYLIKDSDEIDIYSYENENIVEEFENTTTYDILVENILMK